MANRKKLNVELTRLAEVPCIKTQILRVAKSYGFEQNPTAFSTNDANGNLILNHASGESVFLAYKTDESLKSVNYYASTDSELHITGAYLRDMIRSLEVKIPRR